MIPLTSLKRRLQPAKNLLDKAPDRHWRAELLFSGELQRQVDTPDLANNGVGSHERHWSRCASTSNCCHVVLGSGELETAPLIKHADIFNGFIAAAANAEKVEPLFAGAGLGARILS